MGRVTNLRRRVSATEVPDEHSIPKRSCPEWWTMRDGDGKSENGRVCRVGPGWDFGDGE